MAEWFKHDHHARRDPKIAEVMMQHGPQGLGVFWIAVEILHEQGGVMDFAALCRLITFECGGTISKEAVDSIMHVLCTCNALALQDDNTVTSERVLQNLKERTDLSNAKSAAAKRRWDKHEKNKARMHVHSTSNAHAMRREEKREEEKRVEESTHTPRARTRQRDKLIPHIDRVKAHFVQAGATEDEAQAFFDHYEAVDWTTNAGLAITNWQAKANTWIRKNHDNSHRAGAAGTGNAPKRERHVTLDEIKRDSDEFLRRNGVEPPTQHDPLARQALEQPRHGAGIQADAAGARLVPAALTG